MQLAGAGEGFPVEEAFGFGHIEDFMFVVAADHEGFEASEAAFEGGLKGAGEIGGGGGDGRFAGFGVGVPFLVGGGVTEAEDVGGHAPLAGGVAADLFAEAFGEAVDAGGIGGNAFVGEVAGVQVVVDGHTAGVDGVGDAGLVRGAQDEIDAFDVDIEGTGQPFARVPARVAHRHIEQGFAVFSGEGERVGIADITGNIFPGGVGGRAQVEDAQSMVLGQMRQDEAPDFAGAADDKESHE